MAPYLYWLPVAHSENSALGAVYSSLRLRDMHALPLCVYLRTFTGMDKTVFVALTGYIDPAIAADCAAAGFNFHMLKLPPLAIVLDPLKQRLGFVDNAAARSAIEAHYSAGSLKELR